jgi:AcrR family transcriptional regulator
MSTPNEPIWARPEPGQRRPRYTREQIAAAALAIADSEGFDAVSMRRVAAELGSGTMTLYYYVRTKDDLVALMDDAIMGSVLLPELPGGWRAALTAIARNTRTVMVRHPWAVTALQNARQGPNAMLHFEQTLAALAGTSLGPTAKFELLAIVDDFVHGHALRVGEARTAAGTDAAQAFAREQLRSGRYPETEKVFGSMEPADWERFAGWMSDEERFNRGLAALLDGLAATYDLP